MSDIEMVIKIPEEAKKAFDRAESNDLKGGYYDHGGIIGKAIKNGIPLPKGHGDLIDVKDLLEQIELEDTDENREENVGQIITLEDIDHITPIIEADTESEET